jgi:hypothetical protein
MSTKIELGNGGWAILRDPAAVPVKLRRPVEKMLMAVGRGQAKAALEAKEAAIANAKTGDTIDPSAIAANMDSSVIDQFYELNDLLIVARVESWSIDLPISVDSLGELTQEDYELLQKVAAQNVTTMVPNFGLSNNPDSPTPPSGE